MPATELSRRTVMAAAGVGFAGGARAGEPDVVEALARRSETANDALMRGDVDRYRALIPLTEDFILFSPFGGAPNRSPPSEATWTGMKSFFRNGRLAQELVRAYASPDMVVLAVIERADVEVGGLPRQPWALRVTLVYRRQGDVWALAHRHADPLAPGISVQQAAVLARGTAA